MRTWIVALAGMALVSLTAAGQAAEISAAKLGKMGLGNLQTMTDSEGLAVRGMGAAVSGAVYLRVRANGAVEGTAAYAAEGTGRDASASGFGAVITAGRFNAAVAASTASSGKCCVPKKGHGFKCPKFNNGGKRGKPR